MRRVGLKVTSLKCSHEDDNDEAVGRQIPPTLEYSERAERGNEVGIESEEPSSQTVAQVQGEKSSQESTQVQESTQARQDAITKNMLQKMASI